MKTVGGDKMGGNESLLVIQTMLLIVQTITMIVIAFTFYKLVNIATYFILKILDGTFK